MPHKKNPDVFEILRAKTNRMQTLPAEIGAITSNLPVGYHRDLQLTKESLLPAIDELKDCLDMTKDQKKSEATGRVPLLRISGEPAVSASRRRLARARTYADNQRHSEAGPRQALFGLDLPRAGIFRSGQDSSIASC